MAVDKPYADYAWYTDDYKGSAVPEASFPTLAIKASYLIDSVTAGNLARLDTLPDCVKDAVCAASEIFYEYEQSKDSTGRGITSESNDGYSISYADTSEEEVLKNARRQIRIYLSASGLLFRGCKRRRCRH